MKTKTMQCENQSKRPNCDCCEIQMLNELAERLRSKRNDQNIIYEPGSSEVGYNEEFDSRDAITLLSMSSIFILSCSILIILAYQTMILRKLLII